jgi:hypothetical protein
MDEDHARHKWSTERYEPVWKIGIGLPRAVPRVAKTDAMGEVSS